MGYYIDPMDMSKEEWLAKNGIKMHLAELKGSDLFDTLPVCLVNNGAFTAAAVCFSAEEFKDFSNPKDMRDKQWFIVPIPQLLEVGAIPETFITKIAFATRKEAFVLRL